MRVYEAAKEFGIQPDQLIQILREMGVAARSEASTVNETAVAKLRARLERERRSGHEAPAEAIEAVLEDAQTSSRRRRRRKKEDLPEPEPEPEESTADVVADAVEAMSAEAALEAEERGAELVSAEPSEPAAEEPEEEEAAPVEVDAEPIEAEAAVEEEEAAEEAEEEPAEAEPAEAEDAEAEEVEPAAAAPTAPAAEEKPHPKLKRVADMMPAGPARPAPAASAGPGGQVRIQAEGYTSDGRRKAAKGKKKKKGRGVDQGAVAENVQRVMAELKSGGGKKRRRGGRESVEERMEREEERTRQAAEEAVTVRVNEFLSVAELADLIDHTPTEIITSAFKNLGLMVTINQRLDFDQIELLLDEFGFKAVREEEYGAELDEDVVEDAPEDLKPRPPVVTVMGHVDHGKTKLLDFIRRANVVAGEAGGITQHIGAYHVTLDDGRSLSFLDTPGHAAFTAMRARGAEVTDIVILVVAADDSVMPQTIEAISHAKSAGVPVVVAINKVDLPAADPNRVRQQLLEHGVVVEEFGGDVLSAEVSALKGEGVEALLDKVLLQAEMLEISANPDRPAQGTVIEAELDVGKGPVATVLVTAGTLRVGDSFVCGHYDGRVRAMLDERGNPVHEAGPAIPVQVLGFPGVPGAGDTLTAMEPDKAAEVAQTRSRLEREKQMRIKSTGMKLTDISRMMEDAKADVSRLPVIIKGDVDGSVQALSDSLEQLSTSEVQVEVIHRAVGGINESDVLLAATAGAIIIGFHVRPDGNARAVAEREDVDIRLYDIIYEAVEEVRSALEGMLRPEQREVLLGAAEVRQLFKVPRIGTVAGCYVTEGVIDRKARVRVVRDGVQIYQGELGSLKRFKDDVREVREGFECGLNVSGYNDIKVGDVIECFRVDEVARTLAGAASEKS
ncbi:MAG TPA: translation initiation factor IF-2 [Longimicrobiales bacterium]|nr:translation initiation factor IF-2 [Longimicrobiales bacterium]